MFYSVYTICVEENSGRWIPCNYGKLVLLDVLNAHLISSHPNERADTNLFISNFGLWILNCVYCGIGWSDLALFAIFEKQQISADQVYFYEFNSKKISNFGCARFWIAKCLFLKNNRDLKNIFCCCRNFPFTSRNNRQTENSKLIRIFSKYLFLFS